MKNKNNIWRAVVLLALTGVVVGAVSLYYLGEADKNPQDESSAIVGEAPVMSPEAWQQIERDFEQPIQVNIDEDRVFVGAQPAQITIVSYANFLCTHCRSAFYTMNWLLKDRFQGQVRMLIKHRPGIQAWSFDTVGYFEVIARKSPAKALEFYAAVYTGQDEFIRLAQQGPPGESFLQQQVEALGFEFETLRQEVDTALEEGGWADQIIEDDIDEFKAIGATGTPSFVIYSPKLNGGVRVLGNYAPSEYEKIINRLL